MLGAGWAMVDAAGMCGVVWLGVGGTQWLVCFLFYFFAVLVFSEACPLRVVVFCACARGWWPCLCGGLLPGWMLCGVAVRAMDGLVLAVGGYGILLFSRSACMSAFMWLLRIMQ